MASLVVIATVLVLVALMPSIWGVQVLRRRSVAPPEYRRPLRAVAVAHFLRAAKYLLIPLGAVLWAADVPGAPVAVAVGIATYPVEWLIERRAIRPARADPTFRDLAYSRPFHRDPELRSGIEVGPTERELRRAIQYRRIGFTAGGVIGGLTLGLAALAGDWPRPDEGPGLFGFTMLFGSAAVLVGAGIAFFRPDPEIRGAKAEKRPVHIERVAKAFAVIAGVLLAQASALGLMLAFIVDARWPLAVFLGLGVAAGAFYWYRIGMALRALAAARETANRLAPR